VNDACLIAAMERSGSLKRSLWYRYWFFGWLFRDANRGTRREREAALEHNCRGARWLPVYVRRWSTLGALLFAAGSLLEGAGLGHAAPIAFVSACATAPVVAVALAGWLLLRAPASAYVRARRDR
jgi:hypothetical protein